ncbi:hypothetical protein A0H76_2602 [Hepatospora eriocheir]|uniref:Reverse transcriptase RNase H-like domain-containing protein n=1 Tax=Hepatospora eriocheir TaxID=1081669 RepID=A0A1X0Q6H6_9MICR|nr:hypothetical protein HERIO_2546 [Hepatospora eriocheir]ORD98386.1 hypothetical protein A0H76_2602 [Hepatospora eriocheir]
MLSYLTNLEHFKNIIFNSEITIFTDHSNMLFLNSSKYQRVQKWRILIEEYNPNFNFIEGKSNMAADFLSRTLLIQEEEEEKKAKETDVKFYKEYIHPGLKILFNNIK